MAWYDTIKDIGNTAIDFLKNDTVQDIAKVASTFLGDGKDAPLEQPYLMQPPSLGEYRASGGTSRSPAGKPSFGDIGEAGFQKYAALQAYWRYYLKQVNYMKTGTTSTGRRITKKG